jgi:hypothetical protein
MAHPPRIGFAEAWRAFRNGLIWIDENQHVMEQLGRDVEARSGADDAWLWLFERVGWFNQLTMRLALDLEPRIMKDRSGHSETLALLVGNAVTQPSLLKTARAGLDGVGLPAFRVDQLRAGLDYVETGDQHLATPLLINALEGVFWFELKSRGLIERNQRGWWLRTKTGSQVDSLQRALKLMPDIDDDFHAFVSRVVYGGAGNAFRHGTATSGGQVRSAFLVFVLIGWLELRGRADSKQTISAAFAAAQEDQRRSR